MRALMTAQVWQAFFPDLLKKYNPTQQVDFRCSFNKHFLEEGGLRSSRVSSVQFKDGNTVDMDLHFGCSLYVFDNSHRGDFEQIMEFFSMLAADKDDVNWIAYKSFYISLAGSVTFDFSKEGRQDKFPFRELIPTPPQFQEYLSKDQPYIIG